MRRLVVPERELNRSLENGDTASRVVAVDSKGGSELLELHVGRYEQGRSKPRSLDGFQEILYVVSGRGTVAVDGQPHELEPGTAVYVAAGESYEVANPEREPLQIVSVLAPQANGTAPPPPRGVPHSEQPTPPPRGGRGIFH